MCWFCLINLIAAGTECNGVKRIAGLQMSSLTTIAFLNKIKIDEIT